MIFFYSSSTKSTHLKRLKQPVLSPTDGKTCRVPSPPSASASASPAAAELRSKILPQCQRVSQFLSHRDAAAAVHDFHISSDIRILSCGGIDSEFIEECLLYAINHGVQSLRLHWPTKQILRLPAAFLTCETLRELELRNWFGAVKLPGRLSLPNLKTLHLETRLDLDGDDQPFSGLPELEKLTLTNYYWDGLVINAPKLRALEVTGDRDSFVTKEIFENKGDSFLVKEI